MYGAFERARFKSYVSETVIKVLKYKDNTNHGVGMINKNT